MNTLFIPFLPLAIVFYFFSSFPLWQNSLKKMIYTHSSNFSFPILSGMHTNKVYIPQTAENALIKVTKDLHCVKAHA